MTTLPLAEARANLSRLVESAVATHERFEITRNGTRVAVLASAEDFDALLETLDILSDADEVAAVRASLDALERGELSTLEEVEKAVAARVRRGEESTR
ncbi:type II toxin-antitoxin system Phd/YefM family antitoxin [Salana multivorans]